MEPMVAEYENLQDTAVRWLEATGNLKKFTEQEKNMFLAMCGELRLNPFRHEVYGVKYKDNFNIIVGYEVYIKKAQAYALENGIKFSWDANKFDGSGADMSCTCEIRRSDWGEPFSLTVWRAEYDLGNSMWNTKPRTMLRKVAISQAFRLCFPDVLGGMPYTEEEIGIGEPYERNVTDKNDIKKLTSKDPSPEMKKLKSLVEATWNDGTRILTEEEIDAARESVKNVGISQTLDSVERMIAEKRAANGDL